jgi:lipid A 3-O-deacylase
VETERARRPHGAPHRPLNGGRPSRHRWLTLAAVTVGLLFATPPPAAAQAVGVAGLGLFGLRKQDDRAVVLDIEYRFRPRRYGLSPLVGAIGSTDGSSYLRAGLGRDLALPRGWNAHLSLAAGAYFAGAGKNLGASLEFRTALELSYRVNQDLRLGLTWAHLSNSQLGQINPGAETLSLSVGWSQPIRRR